MRSLLIGALLLGGATTPALADPVRPGVTYPVNGATVRPAMPAGPRWGNRIGGRWHGGMQAPGGYGAYRRPVRGFALPRYWIQPGFYIANYQAYRLPPPPPGYGWSRYYDDAVLTDAYGRVYDSRSDVRWDDYEGGYADAYPEPRPDNGLGGAAIGAVAGGVAGNVIAGRGNRTAGTVIGAVAGAVAGAAIDKAEDARRADRRMPPPPHRDGPPPPPRGPAGDYSYDGHWEGTWTREDGSTYTGAYDGRFEGDVEGRLAYGYGGPPPAHWGQGPTVHVTTSRGPAPQVTTTTGPGGYYANGYYYPAPTITTITIAPAEPCYTETTTYVTERRPVRHKRGKGSKTIRM